MADICRVPFGELSGDRLQRLSNVKNRQNGIIAAAAATPTSSLIKSTSSPVQTGKRSYDMSMLEFDSENIDPVSWSTGAKKNKCEPIVFSTSVTPFKSAPARQPHSDRALSSRSSISKTPAGRSPKKHSRSLFTRSFKRIDPPFASVSSTLPFSLDAALNNTVSSVSPTPSSTMQTARAPIPAKWQFSIYEDTPEEEAATVMEHSTLTLDLSSDDEESVAKKSDRGKENTPPEGYSPSSLTTRLQTGGNEMQISEETKPDTALRSPLADLPESEVPLLHEPTDSASEKASKDESAQEPSSNVDAEPVPLSTTVEDPQLVELVEAAVEQPAKALPSHKASSTPLREQDSQRDDTVIFEDETAGDT